MAILKVANIHFDAVGTNRLDYLNDGTLRSTSNIRITNATTNPYIFIGEGTGINDFGSMSWDRSKNKIVLNGGTGGLTLAANNQEGISLVVSPGGYANVDIRTYDFQFSTTTAAFKSTTDFQFRTIAETFDPANLAITSTGNVTIGRTESTVGQRVKLDVAGAINASAILINGSAPISGGNYAMQVYTTSGTWTKPAGLKAIKVTVVGGGGASGNTFTSPLNPISWPGAGAGGTSVRYIDAGTIPGPVAVTVGDGGNQANPAVLSGNTSSFGAFCSATGGTTGRAAPSSGAAGGAGSGGTYNIQGEPGRISVRTSGTVAYEYTVPSPASPSNPGPYPASTNVPIVTGVAGDGGSSLFGSGGSGSVRTGTGTNSNPTPDFGIPSNQGTGYGAGASGTIGEGSSTATAANGTSGIIIVEEFY